MTALVSILIPAHNAARWISETLKSAVSQTWPRTEIIIVDDGSTDDTLSVCERFASARVKVISQPRAGAAAARNLALAHAQGEYVQWLDADDLLASDKIAAQMSALLGQGRMALSSCPWGKFMWQVRKALFEPTPLWCDLPPREFMVRKFSLNLYMQPAVWLAHRALYDASGQWDTTLHLDDDGEYFTRVILASDRIIFVPDARVFYRITGASSLSTIDAKGRKLDSQFRSISLSIQHLRAKEDSWMVRAAAIRYLNEWSKAFYPERPDLVQQCSELAVQMGGVLVRPRLRAKYAWLAPFLGVSAAKKAQVVVPGLKWSILRMWDQLTTAPLAPASRR